MFFIKNNKFSVYIFASKIFIRLVILFKCSKPLLLWFYKNWQNWWIHEKLSFLWIYLIKIIVQGAKAELVKAGNFFLVHLFAWKLLDIEKTTITKSTTTIKTDIIKVGLVISISSFVQIKFLMQINDEFLAAVVQL